MLTPDAAATIVGAIRRGVPILEAVRAGGVTRAQFYRWKRKRPAFAAAVAEAEGEWESGCIGQGPVGTNTSLALRRLRRERPELHAQVMAGRLTPNAAAIEAGFRQRRRRLQVDLGDMRRLAAVLRCAAFRQAARGSEIAVVTDDEVKAAFAEALSGLSLAERRAVWAAAVYGTRLLRPCCGDHKPGSVLRSRLSCRRFG